VKALVRPAASPLLLALSAFSGCLVIAACRSKKPPEPTPSARASSPLPSAAAETAAPRCRAVARDPALVVGNASTPAKRTDDDDEPDLPFATSIGSAAALSTAFAVGGIAARDGQSEAFVAFVPFDGKSGKRVALGAVHGDPDPPLVVADGERALVAVETSDASGRVLSLFRVAPDADKPEAGAELVDVGAGGVGLAAAQATGTSVVVWNASKGGKQALRVAGVSAGAPRTLSPNDIVGANDAESPVVRARPSGYWLAWIEQKPGRDAGVSAADASAEETRPLDTGPRVLTVALLGADGTPSGSARSVSGDDAHVVAFDAATLPDGALALAWREDDAVPGVESGGTELARVAPDGAVQRGRAADETLSAGAPSLIGELGGRLWLFAPGEDDRLRMALVSASAIATSPFVADDSLRGAEVLAAGQARPCATDSCATFLLGRSKGRAVELSVAECRP
jgi:hypothetical protein